MLWHPLPFPIAIILVVMCIYNLLPKRRKRLPRPPVGYDPLAVEKSKNLSAMQKIVDAHKDFTAEVIQFSVSGRKRVETFRLIKPGDELEIRCEEDSFKVYAFGEFVSDLIIPNSSYLPELKKNEIHFEAYLGGRDLNFINNEHIDFASLILFYKMDGVTPTKVNLK